MKKFLTPLMVALVLSVAVISHPAEALTKKGVWKFTKTVVLFVPRVAVGTVTGLVVGLVGGVGYAVIAEDLKEYYH